MNQKSVDNMLRKIKTSGAADVAMKRGGRPRTAMTAQNVKKVKDLAAYNPNRSMKDIETQYIVSSSSARQLVREAGLKSLATIRRPFLTMAATKKREERSQKLLDYLAVNEASRRLPEDNPLFGQENVRCEPYCEPEEQPVPPEIQGRGSPGSPHNKAPCRGHDFRPCCF